jgi:hypothetical protein
LQARSLLFASRYTYTYQGFIHLLACKWLYNYGKPSTFSWRFAAGWCGVSERMAGEAIQWLLKHHYLRITGKHQRTAVFEPVSPSEESRQPSRQAAVP